MSNVFLQKQIAVVPAYDCFVFCLTSSIVHARRRPTIVQGNFANAALLNRSLAIDVLPKRD